jgi:hypothetical protein
MELGYFQRIVANLFRISRPYHAEEYRQENHKMVWLA